MKYLVGIDIGTSGTKVALFDFSGNPLCSHTAGYRLYPTTAGPSRTPRTGGRRSARDCGRSAIRQTRPRLPESASRVRCTGWSCSALTCGR